MTIPFQPGQHPDADQLNAFAEQALPLHEQQATLVHLATCADCRAIVYLAQPPAPQPHPHPAHTRAPLLARWMLAFPAAAALACLILLTIHFRNIASNQIAVPGTAHIETPPPPPPASPEPSAPPAATAQVHTPPTAHTPRTALPAPVAASTHGTAPRAGFGYASAPKPEIAAAPNLQADKSAALSGASYVPPTPPPLPPPPTAPPAVTATAPPQAPLAGAAARRELRSAASQYDMPRAQAKQAAAAGPATNHGNSGIYGGTGQTNLNQNYIEGVPVSSVAQQGSSNPVANAVTVDSADQISGQLSDSAAAAARAKPLPTLPSKLPALSVAGNAQHQLAIDTAGALFRSDDAGVTWQAVPIQWTGRAVSVALMPPPNTHLLAQRASGLTAPTAAAKSAAPSTHATFQLTTDAGDVWISTDGQTWKHK